MQRRFGAILTCLAILGAASAAPGAEKEAADQTGSGLVSLIFALPMALLFLWLVVVGRKSGALKQGRYMAKADEHMDRAMEHMARLERKTDRMIELLESIDRRLQDGS